MEKWLSKAYDLDSKAIIIALWIHSLFLPSQPFRCGVCCPNAVLWTGPAHCCSTWPGQPWLLQRWMGLLQGNLWRDFYTILYLQPLWGDYKDDQVSGCIRCIFHCFDSIRTYFSASYPKMHFYSVEDFTSSASSTGTTIYSSLQWCVVAILYLSHKSALLFCRMLHKCHDVAIAYRSVTHTHDYYSSQVKAHW